LNPVQAMHGDLGMVGERDLLLALSFSGESEEVIKLIPAVRRHGLEVVALVGNADSTLAKLSDVTLEIPCGKEACPFGMAPTNSTTATMAMGDALAMVMIDAIAFNKESYALNHPAGAIGRALVMKATDIMRSGARLAKVSSGATVMETLMAMTAAKSGSAAIVDGNDGLLGIFTDGDFRRVVSEKGETSLNDAITSYMTAKPLFVKTSQYASELLRVFEKRQIDDLPVCDENGRVVGMIDIQDLPKMKVL
jgi:arabinose-5-phosphate isomerase